MTSIIQPAFSKVGNYMGWQVVHSKFCHNCPTRKECKRELVSDGFVHSDTCPLMSFQAAKELNAEFIYIRGILQPNLWKIGMVVHDAYHKSEAFLSTEGDCLISAVPYIDTPFNLPYETDLVQAIVHSTYADKNGNHPANDISVKVLIGKDGLQFENTSDAKTLALIESKFSNFVLAA